MKTFKVTLYQETYTTAEVEANNEQEAQNIVLSGEYDYDTDVVDVTVKESEILDCEER